MTATRFSRACTSTIGATKENPLCLAFIFNFFDLIPSRTFEPSPRNIHYEYFHSRIRENLEFFSNSVGQDFFFLQIFPIYEYTRRVSFTIRRIYFYDSISLLQRNERSNGGSNVEGKSRRESDEYRCSPRCLRNCGRPSEIVYQLELLIMGRTVA